MASKLDGTNHLLAPWQGSNWNAKITTKNQVKITTKINKRNQQKYEENRESILTLGP